MISMVRVSVLQLAVGGQPWTRVDSTLAYMMGQDQQVRTRAKLTAQETATVDKFGNSGVITGQKHGRDRTH